MPYEACLKMTSLFLTESEVKLKEKESNNNIINIDQFRPISVLLEESRKENQPSLGRPRTSGNVDLDHGL